MNCFLFSILFLRILFILIDFEMNNEILDVYTLTMDKQSLNGFVPIECEKY